MLTVCGTLVRVMRNEVASLSDIGESLGNLRRLRMWTQAGLAREAGVSPTTVSNIETGRIERPHFGTLGKLARALGVAPEQLLNPREPVEQRGPALLSLRWARESEEGEFERGLDEASLDSLDSLSSDLDAEQGRLQRLYGEFSGASEPERFIRRQIREVAGLSGSVKASAILRRNQNDSEESAERNRGTDSSGQDRSTDQRDKTD